MAKGVRFSVKQTGDLVGLLKRIREEVRNSRVKVGVLGNAKHQSPDGKFSIGMAELAAIHEYGAPKANIPARSFIGSTIRLRKAAYVELTGKLLKGVYEGKLTVKKALNTLGMLVASDIKTRMETGAIKQDLQPATIARKLARGSWNRGSSSGSSPLALIDTGLLKNSVTWKVEGGGMISEILPDFAPEQIQVQRFQEAPLVNGKRQLGVPWAGFFIDAVVVPMGPRELEMLPEGERTKDSKMVITAGDLRTAGEDANSGSNFYADTVTYRGEDYEVRSVEDYRHQGGFLSAVIVKKGRS